VVPLNPFPPERIRNVVLVGHQGAGKTSLAESLLHTAGVTNRLGRVEDGNTVTDFDPEEKERGLSLSLAVAPFEWQGHKLNLIDTPGYADFFGEVLAALQVSDVAVFVVSAVEGVEVQTEVLWRHAAEMGLPRMFVVNKMDRERASFERTLDQLQSKFGAGVAPIELPIGEEEAFRGVVDLLADEAYTYEGGKGSKVDIPEDMADREHAVHDSLVENIVVADDDLLERYLEGDVPPVAELGRTLAKGVAEASVFPVTCVSATTEIGADRLADLLVEVAPSPAARPLFEVVGGDSTFEVEPDPSGDALAFVFKTIADPYVGHISLFRVLSGTIRTDDHLVNSRSGKDERLHGLLTVRGSEQEDTKEIQAGDIGAVAKLTTTETGDTLARKGRPVRFEPVEPPAPVLSVAIEAKTQADEDKLANAIHRVLEEDPALVIERNDETHQTLVRGMGETHITITLEKLARKFGVEVETQDVRVPYRETVTASAEAEGKYKKQTGGHGQFGVAFVRVEPLDRGGGFEFVDAIVGGAIPRKFIPSVEKGIAETMQRGGAFGYPVVDVRVTCFDGKHHDVDSSEMSFKMAGSLGFKDAMTKAEPVVLEPVSLLTVTVPNEYQGDVMGDLNARRGRVLGTDVESAGEQTITAHVPTSEVLRYAIDLRSMTGGRGRFSVEHDHYDILPSHMLDQVRRETEDAEV